MPVFAFGDGLGESDFGERSGFGFRELEHEVDALFGNGEHAGLCEVSKPIEDRDRVASNDAKDLGEVFGFVAFEERGFCPGVGR